MNEARKASIRIIPEATRRWPAMRKQKSQISYPWSFLENTLYFLIILIIRLTRDFFVVGHENERWTS